MASLMRLNPLDKRGCRRGRPALHETNRYRHGRDKPRDKPGHDGESGAKSEPGFLLNDRRYSAASAIAIMGRRLRVPTAISYACPAWNSVASANGLAINCIDTGSPPTPNPVHTLIAG